MRRNAKRISFLDEPSLENAESLTETGNKSYQMIPSASIIDIKNKLRIYDNITSTEEFKNILHDSIDDIIKDFNDLYNDNNTDNNANDFLDLKNIHCKPLKPNGRDGFDEDTKLDDLYVEGVNAELIPLKINFPAKRTGSKKDNPKRKSFIFTGERYENVSVLVNNSADMSGDISADISHVVEFSLDSIDHDYSINYDEMFNNPDYLGFSDTNQCFVKRQTANIMTENFKHKQLSKHKERRNEMDTSEHHVPEDLLISSDRKKSFFIDLDLVEAQTDTESLSTVSTTETFLGLLDLCDHNEKDLFLDVETDDQYISDFSAVVPPRSPLRILKNSERHDFLTETHEYENQSLNLVVEDSAEFLNYTEEEIVESGSIERDFDDLEFQFPALKIHKLVPDSTGFLEKEMSLEENSSYLVDTDKSKHILWDSHSTLVLPKIRHMTEYTLLSPTTLLNSGDYDSEEAETRSVAASDTRSIVDLLEETCEFAQTVISEL